MYTQHLLGRLLGCLVMLKSPNLVQGTRCAHAQIFNPRYCRSSADRLIYISACAGEGKMFSPGNLRATFDNPNYERLISHYIGEKYTLRYTGGMVPDVFQVICVPL